MRRGVSVRAYGAADKETVGDIVSEGTGVFSPKTGRKKKKEGVFRKKVHKFLFNLSLSSKNETFFSPNLRLFETKFLLLRLIKHNFPFIPPHCGVHIAQSRGTFPDHPAQTLFDLLNRRDFDISQPLGTDKKALHSGARRVFTHRDEALSKLPDPLFIQHAIRCAIIVCATSKGCRQGCSLRTRKTRRSAC